jgi:superfamily II DNA or RNA helicase
MELREYQTTGIEKLRQTLRAGKKRPVMVMSTGGGKSIVFGQIIANVLENGKSILWLVHRRNLVYQMRDVLEEHFYVTPGLILSGEKTDLKNPIQIGTIQTYARRINLKQLWQNDFYVKADVVLIDEAHRSLSPSYKKIIDLYHSKIIIGCTATPVGAGGKGMGEVYDSIVEIADVPELTENGFLAPARYYAPTTPDLSDVKTVMGDYVVKDLEKTVNKTKLNGSVVENWLKNGEGRKTIVFNVNVKHSIAVCAEFVRNGVAAEHLDARSTDEERQAVFDRVESGDTTVICNVALYQEGLDIPEISCIVMNRPTKSLGLWRQCGGRGLRISKEHIDCLIFDHGGVIDENGLLDEKIYWSLDGKKIADKKPRKAKEKGKSTCTACGLIFESLNKCPDCGSPVKSFGKKIDSTDDELKELNKTKKATIADKRRYLGMLRSWVSEKGYSHKMINAKYRSRFGCWPHSRVKDVSHIDPDQAFLNLMKSDMIRYAKRRKAA